MRDIRSRIAQRQGIDLSNHQIQDLAARRLESILDPRAMKPSLLEGLRKSAGAVAAAPAEKVPNEPVYSFEDTTIYDSHRGSMRFIRKLLNPLLKLFFNPNPLIRALHLQAGLNVEAAKRDQERDRRQTEWNALHYEILQRLVTEESRSSLELQALSLRVESLAAKVDFNERRVRGIEGAAQRIESSGHRDRGRPQGRPADAPAAPIMTAPAPTSTEGEAVASTVAPDTMTPPAEGVPSEGARRRRRRRRGRRGGAAPGDMTNPHARTAESPVSATEEHAHEHSDEQVDEHVVDEPSSERQEPPDEASAPQKYEPAPREAETPAAPAVHASPVPAEETPPPPASEPDFGTSKE